MKYLGDMTVVASHYPSMLDYIQNLQAQVRSIPFILLMKTHALFRRWLPLADL